MFQGDRGFSIGMSFFPCDMVRHGDTRVKMIFGLLGPSCLAFGGNTLAAPKLRYRQTRFKQETVASKDFWIMLRPALNEPNPSSQILTTYVNR